MNDLSIFPADIAEMSIAQLARLLVQQLYEIDTNLDQAITWLKSAHTEVDTALKQRFGAQGREALRDTGRGYRPLEILADIEVLRKRGYSAEVIIQKTGLSPKYVKYIVFLLDQGEERLIEGVQRGTIPLTTALEIARANENASTNGEDGQANLGDLLQEAYRSHVKSAASSKAARSSKPSA